MIGSRVKSVPRTFSSLPQANQRWKTWWTSSCSSERFVTIRIFSREGKEKYLLYLQSFNMECNRTCFWQQNLKSKQITISPSNSSCPNWFTMNASWSATTTLPCSGKRERGLTLAWVRFQLKTTTDSSIFLTNRICISKYTATNRNLGNLPSLS